MSNITWTDILKKRAYSNCGKKLRIVEGYCHPTLGKEFLLCWECYEKVWESVVRWGRFIAWNSFDPETPDPTYIDNFPFPYKQRTTQNKKVKRQRPLQMIIP